MTRKDYEAIASGLRNHLDEYSVGGEAALNAWGAICSRLASVLASENPRFDRAKFLNACGWETAWGIEAK